MHMNNFSEMEAMVEIYRDAEKWFLASPSGYLAPMLAMAVLLRALPSHWLVVSLLRFIGVACHEALHLTVGFFTRAKPVRMSLIPRREGNQIILGSVEFERLTWANAWATALAPLVALPALYAVAIWRTSNHAGELAMEDLVGWALAGSTILHCWPSRADWRLALISWPVLGAALLSAALYVWTQDLSVLLAWRSVAS